MSLPILLVDEIGGFYRSRLMLVLWAGLPLAAILIYALTPEDALMGLPITLFVSVMIGSVAALLASVMLAVGLVSEIGDGSLDLFLVRPLRRWHILASKFLAVYACVTVACLLALGTGMLVDLALNGTPLELMLLGLGDSILTTLLVMGLSCSAALLISVFSPSVLIAVILVIFGANQLSAMVFLPALISELSMEMTAIATLALCLAFFAASALAFQRREV